MSLDRPLVPLPAFFDDFATSMSYLGRRAERDGVDLALPVLGRRTDPFRNLRE